MNTFKKSTKIVYMLIIGILIILVIFVMSILFKKQSLKSVHEQDPQTTHSQQEREHFLYTAETDTYMVNVDLETTQNRDINEYIKKDVIADVEEFKVEYEPTMISAQEMEITSRNGRQWQGNWVGEVVSAYVGFISYRVYGYTYTGGAHDRHFNWTYVFNEQGKNLTLVDIFKEGVEYEKILSTLSRKALVIDYPYSFSDVPIDSAQTENITNEEYYFNVGTEAKVENFSRFLIHKNGIIFIFPSYQIAPYSEESFEILIPWEELREYIKISIL